MRRPRWLSLRCVILFWVAGIVSAFGALGRYASRAGTSFAPDASEVSRIYREAGVPGRPLLIMAVHPRCPCTDASLDEMGELLARAKGSCDAVLLAYQARGWPASPVSRQIGPAQVRILPDLDGRIAARLGASTSGHCVLISPDGSTRFYGGLTASRGHRGRSAGQDDILAALVDAAPRLATAPVYGCSLR